MNVEKKTITANGKEYSFLKPFPITIVNIEKQSYVNGEFSNDKYEDALLRMVSRDLKKEDLVKFVGTEVVLENGIKLQPLQITYKQYMNMISTFNKDDATKIVTNFLSICDVKDIKPEDLSMNDIYAIFDAYATLYDKTELNRVIEEIATFR